MDKSLEAAVAIGALREITRRRNYRVKDLAEIVPLLLDLAAEYEGLLSVVAATYPHARPRFRVPAVSKRVDFSPYVQSIAK